MNAEPAPLPALLRHAGWLRRLAGPLLRDADAAEDVVQETLIAAWQHPPGADRDVRPWLAEVARNRARDRMRSERSRAAREEETRSLAEAAAPSAEALIGEREIHRAVAEVVGSLAEPYRETILLRYYEGLTAAAIARRSGVPEGTVRWRVKTGLDEIRRRLDERHEGDRRRWVRALLPLAPAAQEAPKGGGRAATSASGLSLSAGLMGCALVGLLAAAWWAQSVRRAGEQRAHTRAAGEPGDGEGTGGARQESPALAAVIAPAGPTCEARLRRTHEEIVALERDLFAWDRDYVFELGAPNPEAERALAAPIARELAKDRNALEHRLVCRTWACRVAIRRPKPGSYGAGFVRAGDISSRVRGATAGGSDAALGLEARPETFVELDHLALKQPSGAPLAGGALPTPAPRPAPPSPADEAGCAATERALRAEAAALRARWRKAEPKDHKFERSEANPALEAELAPHLPWWTKLFGETECRGQICRRDGRLLFLPSFLWDSELIDREGLYERYRLGISSGTWAPSFYELEPR
jgi:RNA polymerase sigma-70 factor (ECF subfamily)